MLTNCLLRGTMQVAPQAASLPFTLFNEECLLRSVFCATAIVASESTSIKINCRYSSHCVFDSGILTGGAYYSHEANSRIHKLTTAQCKDADYLTGIGFPCRAAEVAQ